MDSYRDRRSPDRSRDRYPPPRPVGGDSYVPPGNRAGRPRSPSPGGYRRGRSRSPPPRIQGDSWRAGGRPRSPPPARRFDSRDDLYAPRAESYRPRDYAPPAGRYDDRPARARSPLPLKRGRDNSPPGPAKRERLDSPPRGYARPRSPARGNSNLNDRGYRPRSRSPPRRDDRPEPYKADSWRRRSPSPLRGEPRSTGGSGRNSVHSNSRRSSPRGFGRRNIDPYDGPQSRAIPPDSHRSPKAPLRNRSPPPARARSPYREPPDTYNRTGPERDFSSGEKMPARDPDAPAEFRGPPSGPASSRYSSAQPPPSGPAASTSTTQNQTGNAGMAGVPSHPRGDFGGRGFGGYRGRGGPRGDFGPPRRGASTWGPGSFGRGGPVRDAGPSRDFDQRGPAAGPRGGSHHRESYGGGAPFRGSSNSTATTFPRTQRFNNPAPISAAQKYLADMPTIKEGGEKLPPLHNLVMAEKLDETAAQLRKRIDELTAASRKTERNYKRLERDSATAALRSELAEEHLRDLNGEGEGVGAF